MSETVRSSEWSRERGQKWVDNLQALEATLEPVDDPLLDRLDLGAATRIADIGCGGGRTLRAIGERAAEDAILHGIDVSPDVIDAARRATSGDNISFHCLDAGAASPPAGSYDRLSSRFGVMFFTDAPAAFRNLAQWLGPGGAFAFAVWGPLGDNPWMGVARQTVSRFVELPKPEPDAPGPFRYAETDRFADLLATCGFRDLKINCWQGELAVGGGLDAESAADFALTAFSMGELLGDDTDHWQVVKNALTERLREYERDSVVTLPAQVHIVTGLGPR